MSQICKKDCIDILASLLGNENFQLDEFELIPFGQPIGFHANHASLTIQAILNGSLGEFKFFVKTATENPAIFEKYWKRSAQFYKEHVFYTKLVKDLQKFVDKKITANCYMSKLNNFMVVEDLCATGYETARIQVLDMDHVEAAIESFVNLHAASLLYEEKTGISISKKYDDLAYESLFFPDKNHPTEGLLYSADKGVRVLGEKYFSHVKSEDRSWFFTQIKNSVEKSLCGPDNDFRKVVCQGDPWGNNILYKYDRNGIPSESILVDFGCQRFAPPALELMEFIYLGLRSDFRARHKSEIVELYYCKLSRILAENGVLIGTVLPKNEFLKTCSVYEEFAMCVRVYYDYFTYLPAHLLKRAASSVDLYLALMTLGDPQLPLEAFGTDDNYKARLSESISDAFQHFGRRIYSTHSGRA